MAQCVNCDQRRAKAIPGGTARVEHPSRQRAHRIVWELYEKVLASTIHHTTEDRQSLTKQWVPAIVDSECVATIRTM